MPLRDPSGPDFEVKVPIRRAGPRFGLHLWQRAPFPSLPAQTVGDRCKGWPGRKLRWQRVLMHLPKQATAIAGRANDKSTIEDVSPE